MNRYLIPGFVCIVAGALTATAMPSDLVEVAASQPEGALVLQAGDAYSGVVTIQSGTLTVGGGIVFDDGPQEPDSQEAAVMEPQVGQILSGIGSGPAGIKQRDAAEEKLVALGPGVISLLESGINGQKGLARDALVVAVFRLENAPLSPRECIAGWISKKGQADPATVSAHHIVAEELRRTFPHHLFYALESTAAPGGKSVFPRTVIALAADGKVQAIGDDALLAKFFKIELPEKMDKGDQRRAASAAAILALARQGPDDGAMSSDGHVAGGALIGTAESSGAKARKATVTLKRGPDGRVETLATVVEDVAPGEQKVPSAPPATSRDAGGGGAAASEPATRRRMHLPIPRQLPPATEPMD